MEIPKTTGIKPSISLFNLISGTRNRILENKTHRTALPVFTGIRHLRPSSNKKRSARVVSEQGKKRNPTYHKSGNVFRKKRKH
ncbi:MAG: hypothetical protein COT84_01840 [Chlamydiae bacterium CG10_big_fil_rev_8_21_14_0_10_35_9]|nr:MAG: hypothetical protein COT84_01840 [Chlamydiae bacterium CG10_big_fil_rev_8_21_14_0_10_35_9]